MAGRFKLNVIHDSLDRRRRQQNIGMCSPLAIVMLGIAIALGGRGIRKHVSNQIPDKMLHIGKAILTCLPFSSLVTKASHSPINGSKLLDGKGKVVSIPQFHWRDGFENDPIKFEKCWSSQCKIAEYLLSHPDDAVFEEGLSETLENYDGPMEEVVSIFPEGKLPSQKDLWTKEQKRFLAEHGATHTLCFLGKIKTVYRSIDPQKGAKIDRQIRKEVSKGNRNPYDPALYQLLFTQREQALAEEVRKFLYDPKNKGRKVNIVYGSAHDFSKYFKPGSITRNSDLETDDLFLSPPSEEFEGKVATIE